MIDYPVFYISMPVNENGDGPADPEETVQTLHEVWDSTFSTICRCPTKEIAEVIVRKLNDN